MVKELGKTTEGLKYIAAFISSEANIAKLDEIRDRQSKIADPRKGGDPVGSKPVVLTTCSIHSDETTSTFMAIELLHQLATGSDDANKEMLNNTILIPAPSANPYVESGSAPSRATRHERAPLAARRALPRP